MRWLIVDQTASGCNPLFHPARSHIFHSLCYVQDEWLERHGFGGYPIVFRGIARYPDGADHALCLARYKADMTVCQGMTAIYDFRHAAADGCLLLEQRPEHSPQAG